MMRGMWYALGKTVNNYIRIRKLKLINEGKTLFKKINVYLS